MSTPSLRGAIAANNAETEHILVSQLVADGADAFAAHVVAVAVMAGLTAALLEWSQQSELSLTEAITAALDTLEGRR